MEVRPNAVRLGIVVVLGVVFTLTLWLVAPGLFGLSEAPATTQVSATVTKGAGCGASDGEIVTFKQDGQEHQAKFDACGHRDGEPVSVSVPAGDLGPDLVVHAAEAATGDNGFNRALAFLLFLASSLAGGAFIHLWLNVIPRSPTPARPASRILPGIPTLSSILNRRTKKQPDAHPSPPDPSLTDIPSLAALSLPDIEPVAPPTSVGGTATGVLPVAPSTVIHSAGSGEEATSKVLPVAEPSWTATSAAIHPVSDASRTAITPVTEAPGGAGSDASRTAITPVSDASRTGGPDAFRTAITPVSGASGGAGSDASRTAITPVSRASRVTGSDLSKTAITPVAESWGDGSRAAVPAGSDASRTAITPVADGSRVGGSDASRTEIHPVARPVSELSSTEIHPVRPLRDE
ncbi:hypothetical protein [Actinocrispum sp. NPDC049592]|uniref:hypothetical protein n=1 Tax=Actinocrispum sp. NPDC049592 TaxID=3154835 RepID=UPI003422BD10